MTHGVRAPDRLYATIPFRNDILGIARSGRAGGHATGRMCSTRAARNGRLNLNPEHWTAIEVIRRVLESPDMTF